MGYILTDFAKDLMYDGLISSDYYTSGLSGTSNGLVEIVLMERYRDVEDVPQTREYTDGAFGGMKEIEWRKFVPIGNTYATSLVQDDDVTFDVESGIDIVGFRLYFFNGTSIEVGIEHEFAGTVYSFDADGYLTISNISIGVNWYESER